MIRNVLQINALLIRNFSEKISCFNQKSFLNQRRKKNEIKILHKVHFARALVAIQKLTERIYAKKQIAQQRRRVLVQSIFEFFFISFLNRIEWSEMERMKRRAVEGAKSRETTRLRNFIFRRCKRWS